MKFPRPPPAMSGRQTSNGHAVSYGSLADLPSFGSVARGTVMFMRSRPARCRPFRPGTGPVTRFWERERHSALGGFNRFAIARGHIDRGRPCHLNSVSKPLKAFVPHIYSRGELRRLLDAVAGSVNDPRCRIDPENTHRTLLLLLYGAGLRISDGACPDLGRCRS